MSHFSKFVPINTTVKLDNGNTVHAQLVGIFLCRFNNFSILYPMRPVYYCPGHPSNTISSGALKFYVGFQNVTSEPLEYCYFVDPQDSYFISPYQTQNNIDYLQIEIVKVNPHRNKNIVVPTFCALSKQFSDYSSVFLSCIYSQTKTSGKKSTYRRSPRKSP